MYTLKMKVIKEMSEDESGRGLLATERGNITWWALDPFNDKLILFLFRCSLHPVFFFPYFLHFMRR